MEYTIQSAGKQLGEALEETLTAIREVLKVVKTTGISGTYSMYSERLTALAAVAESLDGLMWTYMCSQPDKQQPDW